MQYNFIKMNGLGNDFVIIDQRDIDVSFNLEQRKVIANRRLGIGCDQLIFIENTESDADVFMRIYNQDGNEVNACGNAVRCLGTFLADEFLRPNCRIETLEGTLTTVYNEDKTVTADMGVPKLEWQDIPLSKECNTLKLPIKLGVLEHPIAISMGNPHMIFFVKDLDGIDVYNLGKQLTKHELYPQQTNVEFVEIVNPKKIRIKVYERGVGPTLACGTGASASVVAGNKLGLLATEVTVILDGGELAVTYKNNNVIVTGKVNYAFKGIFDNRLFDNIT